MIVPQFWAEGRLQHRHGGRQVTVRRFGWSDESQADAQSHAEDRAHEALDRLLTGDRLRRREPRVPYNGAEGVPIREEVVGRHGETIITRNSYGARCLNTPNVFFADIDLDGVPSYPFVTGLYGVVLLAAGVASYVSDSWTMGVTLTVVGLVFATAIARGLYGVYLKIRGGAEVAARHRIDLFLRRHPQWSLRLYRTPAGYRVMATHQTFHPDDPEVLEGFNALDADRMYVRMCLNQKCFRARVSAKPWRIGIEHHMKPRPGVWPVAPERLAERNAWIERYETAARGFAACSFVEVLGVGDIHPDVRPVIDLHDRLSQATSSLPIA